MNPTREDIEQFISQSVTAALKGTPLLVVKSWCDALELNYPEHDSAAIFDEITTRFIDARW